jgi:hypothetical protein
VHTAHCKRLGCPARTLSFKTPTVDLTAACDLDGCHLLLLTAHVGNNRHFKVLLVCVTARSPGGKLWLAA